MAKKSYAQLFLNIILRIISAIPFLRRGVAHLAQFKNLRKVPSVNRLYEKRMRFIMERNTLPEIVLIENTNFCNANCVMCPHSKMRRGKGFMDFELFKKIIDDCAAIGIKRVQLNATGEPLMDKNFVKEIAYAKKRGIPEVYFFTNGLLLTDNMASDIVNAKADICVISFDSYNKESYERIRGIPFDIVKDNILNFLRKNKEQGGGIYVIMSTILIEDNIKEIKKHPFYRELRHLAHKVALLKAEGAHDWAGSIDNLQLGKNKRDVVRKPCRRLWSSFNILWDGRIALCDMDYEGENILGDMKTQTIKEVWDGPAYRRYREIHLKRDYNSIRLCKYCLEDVSWWKEHSEDPRRL